MDICIRYQSDFMSIRSRVAQKLGLYPCAFQVDVSILGSFCVCVCCFSVLFFTSFVGSMYFFSSIQTNPMFGGLEVAA